MKKVALIVMAVAVAVMFASVAVAATSTSTSSSTSNCPSCVKPGCVKCITCAKPGCNACAKLPKVTMNWAWPTMKIEPGTATTSPKVCDQYKRDVMGQKVPNQTVAAGNAMTDKATRYENTLVVGQ